MKKFIFIIVSALTLSACSDFLDVKPQANIDKDELFKTKEGFMEALNGVYSSCISGDLYGGELTFGFPDVLAQNYSVSGTYYQQISEFNYKSPYFMALRDQVWSRLYSAISNTNLILDNIEGKPDVLPEGTYNIVKGEALALRAYLHFDAFRLFNASIATNPFSKNIPYVTEFSADVTPRSEGTEVLKKAIADLMEARQLLATSDPIRQSSYVVGYTYDSSDPGGAPDDGSNEETATTLFLQNRRHRMNYYAATATLARVHLANGSYEEARAFAEEVINANKFKWTAPENFAAIEDELKDRILYKELIFGWYIEGKSSEVDLRFASAQVTATSVGESIYEVNGPGAEDLRFKQWFLSKNTGFNALMLQKYIHEKNVTNLHYLMAPAIRLSEMYYIAAECTFQSDPEKALGYINTVRFNRGIGTKLEGITDQETFITELIKDARKEFFGEGQIFYMYKRLNKGIVGQGGSVIPASPQIYILPLPQNEIEFGQGG